MTANKSKTRIVAVWCHEIPVDEFGDRIRDAEKFSRRVFPSTEQAVTFLKSVDDQFGAPRIEVQEYQIDQDIQSVERRTVWTWETIEEYAVDQSTGELDEIY